MAQQQQAQAQQQQIQQHVNELLKKTSHYDKDERYMATSDLCEVLKKTQGHGGGGGGTGTANAGNAGNATNTNTNHHPLYLDSHLERQICTAVLRLLHDKSNDVQAVAVKTLGVLLTTVQQEQVLEIADSLADQVLDANKSELRDVYAIGLRTLVKTCPVTMGGRVSQRLLGRLLDGIRNTNKNQEIVLSCLDILTDLLGRFGATAVSVTRQHEAVLQICLQQLNKEFSQVIRKRAGNTLACLSTVLSDALLHRMVEALLYPLDFSDGIGKIGRRKSQQRIASSGGSARMASSGSAGSTGSISGNLQHPDTRALIRTMCTVSAAVGHRLGQEQIDRILPIFLRFTEPEDAVTGDDDEDEDDDDDDNNNNNMDESEEDLALANELRESCFMGFESFVSRCPVEVEPHLDQIIASCLAYMSYDPNYSYGVTGDDGDTAMEDDDDDNEEYEDEEDDDDEYEEEDEEDEDDDDDESWKVRRSAIRALKAVVIAKKHDPGFLWTKTYLIRRGRSNIVAKCLVQRFKEREENCRVGVMDCFTKLLAESIQAAGRNCISFAKSDSMTDTSVTIDLQSDYAPALVKACQGMLAIKKGNDRSKSKALALLSTLSQAPGGIGGQTEIASVFAHVKNFLSTDDQATLQHREVTSKALRLDALSLVRTMLASDTHDPVHVRKSLYATLLPELCHAVEEQWYKVIAEALRALAQVPRFFVLGYTDEDDDDAKKEKEQKDVANQLYQAIEPLLAAHDVDQEIKECALNACAALLSNLHACLTEEQSSRELALLLERLKNETTRIAAIKTISKIAAADSGCDLTPILSDSIASMASFLQLQSRTLKQTSLEALDIVITNHGGATEFANNDELYATVLQELAPLLADRDMHLSHLSLCVAVSTLRVCPHAGASIKSHILQPALALSTSQFLQDSALDSLLALFKQMIVSNAIEFEDFLGLLQGKAAEKVGKHGVYNLAKCIAAITASTEDENVQKVLKDIFKLLDGSQTPSDPADLQKVQLSLLITGYLGRMIDLASHTDRMKKIYIGYFDSWSEELKNAASHAMGNASVGCPSNFLQAIVAKLDEDNKKQQYLLLSALRDFIQCNSRSTTDGEKDVSKIADSLSIIVPPLERHCSDSEEGVRGMVAECLGSLTCLLPETMLKKLEDMQKSHSAIATSGCVVASGDAQSKKNAHVCSSVASSIKLAIAGKVDPTQLVTFMPTFVELLKEQELHVRTAALLMVLSAVHHMPQVVSGLLKDAIMPSLYEVAKLKLERKVDLGPFTHTVDDALPLRKAALSIFANCLENLPGSLDISEFMPILANALGDAEDVQLHAHQIVISMCARQPSYIAASVESFVAPLEKTIGKKPGQKTGTELERLNDWIKSALRVMLALSKLEGALNSQKFVDFVERIKATQKWSAVIAALEEER